jgi:chromosome segregation ATPase
MAVENGQSQELDLDKTDRLPILQGVIFDDDVLDDAVRLDRTAAPSGGDFIRSSSIDLPSLAESVRTVEERIARQNAEFEALTRSYERARDAENSALARASAMERDLAAAKAAVEAESVRSRDFEKSSLDKAAALDAARTKAEESARDLERQQSEARILRESLAAREATIVQVLHALSERDAQLSSLQAEHAKVLPALEARIKSGTQLEDELSAVRAQLNTASAELKGSRQQASALGAQTKRQESEIRAVRADLALSKTHATSYLELLRTRDWRSNFHQNLFRDMDAKIGAADGEREALKAERNQLLARLASYESTISMHSATIEQLQSSAAAQAGSLAEHAKRLQEAEQQGVAWTTQLSALEAERARLQVELATREQALSQAQASADGAQQRITQLQSEHAAKIAALEADAQTREQEMTVLMAHLKEARRPIETIEAEVKRLKEELGLKSLAINDLTEETDKLRTALERTRGQLEEREFLIRRLERSESNNANVLGRIQTSMERLGSSVAPNVNGAPAPEWSPELTRIDGDRSITHALGRRTRIGRAAGCELHIDSSSVSRHHALILAGTREAIIEDLNSTNGVIINGRKVTRQVLNDGDILTLGDIQFRYVAKPAQPALKG